MAKRKKKLILLRPLKDQGLSDEQYARKHTKLIKKTEKKAKRAVNKVEREAYAFAPDSIMAIAIDYKNQRIMIKEVEGDGKLGHDFLHKLEMTVREQCMIGRMKRGWGLGRDCRHPRSRWSWKNYCIGSEQGVLCFRRAKFCTMCGAILSTVEDEPLKATLQEMVAAKAAYPQIRRVT